MTFLSAAQLKISDKERTALIGTLEVFESGRVPFVTGTYELELRPENLSGFNMSNVLLKHDCGTAGCILGWARSVAKDDNLLTKRNAELNNLFGMGIGPVMNDIIQAMSKHHRNMGDIKPDEAGRALRNYLSTGQANWMAALSTHGTVALKPTDISPLEQIARDVTAGIVREIAEAS